MDEKQERLNLWPYLAMVITVLAAWKIADLFVLAVSYAIINMID